MANKSRVIAKTFGKVASEARISLDDGPFDKMVLGRLAAAYITLTIARTLVAVLDSFSAVYHRTSPASVAKPIKSYVQVATLRF